MALLLCLGLTAALARGCLHCHSNFSEKFSFYRHHVNLKSWWVGDIPVSGSLLTDWSQDTMKELHLAIPAEISECGERGWAGPGAPDPRPGPLTCVRLPPPAREKLDRVANAVYQKMDQLYQGKMYFPGKRAAATREKPRRSPFAHRASLTFLLPTPVRVFPECAASHLSGAGAPHPKCHHRK